MLLDVRNETLSGAATLHARLNKQRVKLAARQAEADRAGEFFACMAANTSRSAIRSRNFSGSKFAHIISMITAG